ncbi:hypothetical protein PRZ48_009110 [Zasmidium cellare]|uniref:NAD(P)-binding domain-containing protein n=1 Tax=Zasmidium cellare TaxID=395010 RepID=A0ABR0EIK4_ZASCE|nr:hypothetical protein PRZ48_009110 [Zasmidium cellare]
MSQVKFVAIAGISGALALLIVQDLLARGPNVRIRGSSRDPSKRPAWIKESSRVKVLRIDNIFYPPSLDQLVLGSDVVICACLADKHKLLIDACERKGVPRYLASDWTVDYTKLDYGDNYIKDPMKNVKKYLEESKHNVKGVHILVGVFLELHWKY